MFNIATFFRAFLSAHRALKGARLGTERDPIRQMLFASQSLEEMAARIRTDGQQGPVAALAQAASLARNGQHDAARALLHTLVADSTLETRAILWAWRGLRDLGEAPAPSIAHEVLGIVLEMPSGGGYDTLAGYADGSARYLNFSGAAIFWDRPDDEIKYLCQALLAAGAAAGPAAQPRSNVSLPRRGEFATLLTRAGLFGIGNPATELIGAGTALLMKLIARTEEEKTGARHKTANGK